MRHSRLKWVGCASLFLRFIDYRWWTSTIVYSIQVGFVL